MINPRKRQIGARLGWGSFLFLLLVRSKLLRSKLSTQAAPLPGQEKNVSDWFLSMSHRDTLVYLKRHFYVPLKERCPFQQVLCPSSIVKALIKRSSLAIFFSVHRIFCMPSFHPLFTGLFKVWSICKIFFVLSCVKSLSLRSFRPVRPKERPHMRARCSTLHPFGLRKTKWVPLMCMGWNVWLSLKVEKLVLGLHFNFHSRAFLGRPFL